MTYDPEIYLPLVCDFLRQEVSELSEGGNKQRCDFMPEGRPPSSCGDLFVGVDELGIDAGKSYRQAYLQEEVEVGVWISWRLGRFASDRLGAVYRRESKGLTAIERKIVVALHGNFNILCLLRDSAIASGLDGDSHGIISPLWYVGRGSTQTRGGEWDGSEGGNENLWLVRMLRFRGLTRTQGMPHNFRALT